MHAAFWDEPLTYLPGVGPKRAERLADDLGLRTYLDLLHYYPRRYVHKGAAVPIGVLPPDSGPVTVVGELGPYSWVPGRAGKRILKATLHDASGTAELAWFQGAQFVLKKYPPGSQVRVYGKPTFFHNRVQFTHPELELLTDGPDSPAGIEPVYGTTEALGRMGLDSRGLARLTHTLIERGVHLVPEVFGRELLQRIQLLGRAAALAEIHVPTDAERLVEAQRRLKFEELFFFQLLLAQHRRHREAQRQAPPFRVVGDYFNRFYQQCLPFALTEAQKRVLREIRHDVGRPLQMNRLVQGDVGSGKTLVALMTMLLALDNGYQACLMAPTEILAEQHAQNLQRLVLPLGIRVGLLTGSVVGAARKEVLLGLASGSLPLVVGTHALIEDGVQFQRLGLVVVDEQHKFGVLQRSRLWAKTAPHFPHNLMLTATPIPRTLALTAYGEIDVSVIDELPPGRTPIRTLLLRESQRLRLLGELKKGLAAGAQVYVVYPLVTESSASELLAVDTGVEALVRALPGVPIGRVHGQLSSQEKAYEMAQFAKGRTRILVATTVIEVGVDVPSATLMVIENAERFGLSQLHQLRGRVGRGQAASTCILMAGPKAGRAALDRLAVLRDHTDGFVIAQKDLELRGPGDFLGTKQSGLPEFRLADIVHDSDLLVQARTEAFNLIATDPPLALPEHAALADALRAYRRTHPWDALSA
ncbi:MAG: ATP-dependent DNA helicase RecG [Bacteroidia bacterium]|nr:ATP-dependent DNA helicase RecG [Bacteroidia bacterium]